MGIRGDHGTRTNSTALLVHPASRTARATADIAIAPMIATAHTHRHEDQIHIDILSDKEIMKS